MKQFGINIFGQCKHSINIFGQCKHSINIFGQCKHSINIFGQCKHRITWKLISSSTIYPIIKVSKIMAAIRTASSLYISLYRCSLHASDSLISFVFLMCRSEKQNACCRLISIKLLHVTCKPHILMTFLGYSMFLIETRHEKTCLCHMRPTKAQISLRIRAVWSAPLLFAA